MASCFYRSTTHGKSIEKPALKAQYTNFFKRKGKNLPLYRLWFQKISLEGGRKLFSTMKLNDLMDLFWGYMNEIKSQ